MRILLEWLSLLNWFALPLTLLQSLWYADWRGSQRQHGALGLPLEAAASLLGANAYPFFVPADSEWSGANLGRLLSRHGVRIWDVGYFNGEMFFRVRKNQAAWAQYVMQRAGVPLTHRLYAGESPDRVSSASSQATSGQTSRSGQGQSFPSSLLDWADSLFGR